VLGCAPSVDGVDMGSNLHIKIGRRRPTNPSVNVNEERARHLLLVVKIGASRWILSKALHVTGPKKTASWLVLIVRLALPLYVTPRTYLAPVGYLILLGIG
jgi:hypothetical protein